MSFFLHVCTLLYILAFSAASQGDAGGAAGVEALIDDSQRGFIIVGELHGTQQGPEFMKSLTSSFLDRGIATATLFEVPGQFDAVLGEAPSSQAEATRRFCAEMRSFWEWSRDGRGTTAMLEVWSELAVMQAAGEPVLTVGAHDLTWGVSTASQPSGYVRSRADAMAERVLSAASRHDVVIVNVGAAHPTRIHTRLLAAPEYDGRPITRIVQRFSGGEAWNCQRSQCRTHPIPGRYVAQSTGPGVQTTTEIANYDAFIHLGQATPAPPVRETSACGELEPYQHLTGD